MNKVKVMLCGVCVMLTCLSCTNTNTVNVLISNRGDGDCRDKYIEVPVEKIHARLQTTPADTLIVMNEKNMPIHYGYSKDSSRIVFRVPLIRKKITENLFCQQEGSEPERQPFQIPQREYLHRCEVKELLSPRIFAHRSMMDSQNQQFLLLILP